MATTWAILLADVRAELKDDDASPSNYEWSDALLYLWCKDAVSDYSQYNPVTKVATLSVITGASYSFPTDYLVDLYVEAPTGYFMRKRYLSPGRRFTRTTGTPIYYWITGSTLYLNAETTDDVDLTYNAIHTSPDDVDDDTFEFTVPVRDEEMIRLFMRAKAHEQMRSGQSSLDRFALGSGARDDNPIEPEYDDLMEEYERKMYERYGGGIITLYRA